MRLPRGWLAAAVGGALQAIALALPGLALAAPLQLMALALLAAGVMGAAPRQAAQRAGLHATVATAGTVWWLHISMHDYGGLPAWLSVLAVLALSAFLGSWCALTMALQARLLQSQDAATARPWRPALGFVAAWLAYELARAQWFTGFPWGMSGYAHVDGLLAVAAPWLGVYGMGALAAALSAGLVLLLRAGLSWRRGVLALAGLAASAVPLAPADFTTPAGPLDVTLLQGNVAQDDKFDPARIPESLAWHARSLLEAQGDLVVAPETALPLLPEDLPAGLLEELASHFGTGRTRALIGVPLGDPVAGFSNSAIGLGGSPTLGTTTLNGLSVPVYRYDKHHLVPFGEFIPWGFRWFVDLMQMPLGDFSRGRLDAPPFEAGGLRLAPNICYEDLFGEDLAVRFRDPAQAPHVLVNLSNIGWFGRSVAVPQHLQISRLRSLELQRPMLRATNTGATAVIDHHGRVTRVLPPFERGQLVAQVQGRSGLTPFARWAAPLGLWPAWALAVLMLVVATGGIAFRSDRSPGA